MGWWCRWDRGEGARVPGLNICARTCSSILWSGYPLNKEVTVGTENGPASVELYLRMTAVLPQYRKF